ncbi:MAG: NAD(P)H-hydrate dehydratase [Fimbriimonadaceae bacterium]|nr:NAD(P)H-hydrate dehydratase [Fimbriimonadaceae bacterium]
MGEHPICPWICNAEESRELDRRARDEFGIPVQTLMERAGQAVFEALREMVPPRSKIVFVCGKGNNGGDGLVAARLAYGADFEVVCLVAASQKELSKDAHEQCDTAIEIGVQPIFVDDPIYRPHLLKLREASLIVDALLGTGARGNIEGILLDAIFAINESGVPVLSVDIPSGIDCDTGQSLGVNVRAKRTVTFGTPKPFLFQNVGAEESGIWDVADIGFPPALLHEPRSSRTVERQWVGERLPSRGRNSHKGANGSVLIVAGSPRMPGAATLAATAAYRAGAGLVTVAAMSSVCESVAKHLPEAILLPLPEMRGAVSPEAVSVVMDETRKYDSAVFGPGLSMTQTVRLFQSDLWKYWEVPSVIDADALNAVSVGVKLPKAPCVLTPHPGEMGRMMSVSATEIQAARFAFVRQAAKQFEKTVLLKGAYSLVAEGDEPTFVNTTGNPGMAVAGMGDVLSGVIATLLAQGLSSYEAAVCGMYWHGLAGDLCARQIGAIGYTASEVADALPKARATITST